MAKSWMTLSRISEAYMNRVDDLLDKAFQRATQGDEILCPCKRCCNRYWEHKMSVHDHLIADGFVEGYNEWVFHGEGLASTMENEDSSFDDVGLDTLNDIDGMLHDVYTNVVEGVANSQGVQEGPTEEAKKFYNLVEEGKQELYLGCKNFSKLSFTIRLYLFKCLHGLSNVAFGNLLELLKEAFPEAKLPESFNNTRKTVRDLGLSYEKIHVCPNDCMLFWDEHGDATLCHVCGAFRWKLDENCEDISNYRIPAKVLRYFPLTPRLQRLFMCPETATAMRWNSTESPTDGNLRHPTDGKAWKDFDAFHPLFAQDSRNVNLALASDGFNPFWTMSISHSTWPVVLISYNLSP